MRPRVIAVIAALSMLFSAGIAGANTEETKETDPRGDTLFNFGYDAQAQLFLFNTQATDSSPYDCTLQNGMLTATYGEPQDDGAIPVVTLADGKGFVSFDPTNFALADGTEATGSTNYAGADATCGISAFAIGEQGQINHGRFMKLFNELVDMRGRGCLNRWLAQSNLGKDDQQVKTPNFEDPESGKIGIDFTTVIANCDPANKEKGEGHPGRGLGITDKDQDHPGRGNGNGHQDAADAADAPDGNGHGRPDSPGNSKTALGRSK